MTTKPFFYHGSILRNMKLIDSDLQHIIAVLKQTGIYDFIMKLPKQLKTEAASLPIREQYLLGLSRLLLMNSEVLILYEFPNYLSSKDKEFIKTVLMFSANEDIADISDQVYEVERGRLKKVFKLK